MRARGPTARELVSPTWSQFKPIEAPIDVRALNVEAVRLAIGIAKNMTTREAPWPMLLRRKRILLALLKTLKNMVRNKRRMAAGNHDLVPLFYIWTMTNACNFTCEYCSNHRGDKYPDLFKRGSRRNLDTAQAKALVSILRESSAIYFCGGEPTLRKDLPELLAHSARAGMFNMINTNGSLIGDLLLRPAYKDFLLHMDVLIISLDSLDTKNLAKMYGVHEPVARKVLRNLLALRVLADRVPFKLVANTVISVDNLEDCFDILDFCCDLGITFSPVAMNIGQQVDARLLENPRYQELVGRIIERARAGYPMIASARMLDRLLHGKIEKCYPTVFDHVDHDGRLFWPCKSYPAAAMVNVLRHRDVGSVHRAASKLVDPTCFYEKCNGHCQWMQDCVTETYATALIEGFLDSGLIGEIKGLVAT